MANKKAQRQFNSILNGSHPRGRKRKFRASDFSRLASDTAFGFLPDSVFSPVSLDFSGLFTKMLSNKIYNDLKKAASNSEQPIKDNISELFQQISNKQAQASWKTFSKRQRTDEKEEKKPESAEKQKNKEQDKQPVKQCESSTSTKQITDNTKQIADNTKQIAKNAKQTSASLGAIFGDIGGKLATGAYTGLNMLSGAYHLSRGSIQRAGNLFSRIASSEYYTTLGYQPGSNYNSILSKANSSLYTSEEAVNGEKVNFAQAQSFMKAYGYDPLADKLSRFGGSSAYSIEKNYKLLKDFIRTQKGGDKMIFDQYARDSGLWNYHLAQTTGTDTGVYDKGNVKTMKSALQTDKILEANINNLNTELAGKLIPNLQKFSDTLKEMQGGKTISAIGSTLNFGNSLSSMSGLLALLLGLHILPNVLGGVRNVWAFSKLAGGYGKKGFSSIFNKFKNSKSPEGGVPETPAGGKQETPASGGKNKTRNFKLGTQGKAGLGLLAFAALHHLLNGNEVQADELNDIPTKPKQSDSKRFLDYAQTAATAALFATPMLMKHKGGVNQQLDIKGLNKVISKSPEVNGIGPVRPDIRGMKTNGFGKFKKLGKFFNRLPVVGMALSALDVATSEDKTKALVQNIAAGVGTLVGGAAGVGVASLATGTAGGIAAYEGAGWLYDKIFNDNNLTNNNSSSNNIMTLNVQNVYGIDNLELLVKEWCAEVVNQKIQEKANGKQL